jgi:hypothetical protein
LVADTGYGSAEMLDWLVNDRGIEPHIPVFDKSKRTDDTFSREDFAYDHASDTYRCPGGKTLRRYRRQFTVPRIGVMKDNSVRYRASKHDCAPCPLKPRCCPNAPTRKVPRSIYEGARDLAREIAKTDAYQTTEKGRDAVRAPQANSEARSAPITRTKRSPRRVPPRRNCPEPPQTRQADPTAEGDLGGLRRDRPLIGLMPSAALSIGQRGPRLCADRSIVCESV